MGCARSVKHATSVSVNVVFRNQVSSEDLERLMNAVLEGLDRDGWELGNRATCPDMEAIFKVANPQCMNSIYIQYHGRVINEIQRVQIP